MKRILFFALNMLFVAAMAMAQFPGGGHPGGGYPGGGHPGGRPPRGERPGGNFDPSKMDRNTQQVRQKKVVRSGSTFKVVGTLRDSISKETLLYVNVALLQKEDSSFVRGASTDLNGQFEITEIPTGEYFLRVSYIGYQTLFMPIKVENNTALGTILLKPGAQTLQAATITAKRPLYAMDGEKMIYNVAEDPSIQSGTTSDALQNAPGVEVDIEGNITLRGVSSVEIWVNDKPSKLTAENLKTYLETLPANALDHIETITNPSAKYATESEAVINIITSAHIKKNHFISFGLNGSSRPSVSPWMSYMWANERLSFNIYASGRYSYTDRESEGWTIKKDSSFAITEIDSSSSLSHSSNLGGNIFMNMNYTIDSMSELEVHGSINFSNSNSYSYSEALRDESFQPGRLRLYYADSTENPGSNSLFGMFGAAYTKKFDLEGHNLRIFADGNFNHNNSDSRFVRNYDGTTLYTNPLDQQKYYSSVDNGGHFALRGRYNRPYSKDGEMSYGLNYDYNSSSRNYLPTFTLADGRDSVDGLRQYRFTDYEHAVSGDVNWTHRWGGFTLELGMGADLTNVHFEYNADNAAAFPIANLNDANTLTFLTFTPSIHTSYRTQSLHNFKLNYTLRMRNPESSQLSTRRNYSEDSYSTGNPNLKSSLTHNAEAGWNKYFRSFGNIGVEGYVRYSQNEISSLSDVTDAVDLYLDRLIQYTMPYNMGSSYRAGTSVNMMIRPSGFFNIRFYGNLYNSGYTYDYAKLGKVYSDNMWSYSFRLNAWAKVWNQYQVFASASYSSPTQSLFSTRKARYSMDCGVRSDFFKRKLSVFLNVQDIFNWGKTIGGGSTNTNPFLESSSTTYTINSRYISAGLTLRFGRMELERNAKEGGDSDSSSAE